MTKEPDRIGRLEPQYTFILNPYTDARFTRCPHCEQPMKLRKLPLFIHVDPLELVVLNKTCRYCPDCDLLIAHQDQIEAILLQMFPDYTSETIHEHYLIIGTIERKVWRKGLTTPLPLDEGLRHLHDFKAVHTIHLRPAGWYPE